MAQGTVTRWWWVRHAPVEQAYLSRLYGQADMNADLSNGPSFTAVADRLPKAALWLTSNLKRTQQTAQALQSAGAENIKPSVEPAFAEQCFGDWCEKTWDEIGFDKAAQAFWNDPANIRPPGENAESFVDLCERVAPRINQITYENLGQDIICVAHAGSIRAAVALALSMTAEQALALDIQNTSVTRLDFMSQEPKLDGNGNWRVIGLNQFC